MDSRMAMDVGLIVVGVAFVALLFVGIWVGEITERSRRRFVVASLLLASAPVLLLWGTFEETSHRCTEVAPNSLILAIGWLGAGCALALGSGLVGRIAFRNPMGAVTVAALTFVATVSTPGRK